MTAKWSAKMVSKGETGSMYEVCHGKPMCVGQWWTVWVPRSDLPVVICTSGAREIRSDGPTGARVLKALRSFFPIPR